MRRPRTHALTGVMAAGLACVLTGSAVAGSTPSQDRSPAKHGSARAQLTVRDASVRIVGGRIAAHATIVNTGRARARHTTGALALGTASRGALGVHPFPVASLAPGKARGVRFTAPVAGDLPLRSGRVKAMLCADVDSQVRRFSTTRNCTRAGAVALTTAAGPQVGSEPVRETVLRSRPTRASSSTTAVLRFGSSSHRGRFRCSLDGGPWLACTSPRRYVALVNGPHTFEVRATSRAGQRAAAPARVSWTVDSVAPTVALQRPVNGSSTGERKPVFAGTGGTAPADLRRIAVKLFAGRHAAGAPAQTLTTKLAHGRWLVAAAQPLGDGTYTAQAQQPDLANNTGLSTPVTFTVNTAATAGGGAFKPQPRRYSIGGRVSGLSGSVVLQDNGGDDLHVSANGSFKFATTIASGSTYNVTVATNPSGQRCTVTNGTGKVGSTNVTSVRVTCVTPPPPPPPTYAIGGTATGVSGTLVLQDNGGDDLNVNANGSFTFGFKLASGAAYQVTVKSSPSGEQCSVSNGSGTVGSSDVTNVVVTCVTTPPPPGTYSIGGTVSGLSGTAVLQDNGADDLNVDSDGSFMFPSKLATGGAYKVTVASNPTGQTCTVANGSGTVGSADVTNVTVTCTAASTQVGQDDFNRADGNDLGSGWTATSDGSLSIKSQQVVGAAAPAYAGDIRTAAGETYGNDQYSQIEVTANSIGAGVGGAGEWIGPSVRSQNGGQDTYLGIYFWNSGSPQLQLYVRHAGNWTKLGSSVNCGVLPAGTQLTLSAVGSTISFAQNGVAQITVTDTSLTGGAPGIIAYDAATADNWSGGSAVAPPPPEKMQVQFDHTDTGVDYYNVISSDNGPGAQQLRVLKPTNPAPGVPHNFLYALPVESGVQTTYGDGIQTLQQLNAQNQYNLTIIEPSFGVEPWYADNPSDANLQYETFMADDLVQWVSKNLATTSSEQNWLIGFSKSAFGAQDLILKHPDVFTTVASWDFPADMDAYTSDQGRYVGNGVNYGTDSNFQSHYRLTASFVNARKAPFQGANRIWIGGYNAFETDVSDYDALLTSDGITHTTETPTPMPHRWDSGWVPIALGALAQGGAALSSQ